MLQRHTNNTQGNFFFKDKNFLGRNPPTVEQLQEQIKEGDMSYINKLRYLAKGIRGCDSFWRGKTEELEAWIDFHISRGHGPPTHFITLSCAENWWSDLRRLMIELEERAGNKTQVKKLEENDFKAMCKSAKRFNVYVNDFFLKRSKVFLDTVVKNAMGIEHYWARVEFAPGEYSCCSRLVLSSSPRKIRITRFPVQNTLFVGCLLQEASRLGLSPLLPTFF
jgi:hypothetical protein